MARRLGYGGLGNTNGARSFSGKAAAAVVVSFFRRWRDRPWFNLNPIG